MSDPPRALHGLRVLDLAADTAGSFCAMLMADMGAGVLKLQPPVGEDGVSPLLPAVNRNKRGLVLDLERPEGVTLLKRLVAGADVLVESHGPEVARRLGVDHDALAALNPRLVYCAISAFGRTGPRAGRPGDDLIAQAMSGIMSATGSDGGPPAKVGVPITELGAGLFAAVGILAAVRARHRTGRGQLVDASLFEAGLALSAWEATEYWYTGQIPRGLGTAHRLNAPYQAFRAGDGHFTVGAANDNLFPRFCALLGLDHLIRDPRFGSVALRLQNRAVLEPLVEAVTVHRPRAHWLARCEEAGVPAGPIYSVPEALEDAHARARRMVQELTHPQAGVVKGLGNPVKMSRTSAVMAKAAPVAGADTDAILSELGLGAGEIASLRDKKVVA